MGAADVTLYAKWESKQSTLLYSAGLHNGNPGGRSGANEWNTTPGTKSRPGLDDG